MSEATWTLEEPVGDGPHGTIWLAEDDSGNRALLEVASGPEGEPAMRLRGMRMSRVRHPFLMRVDGVTRVDDHSALVAEPFPGTGLDGLMAQGAMPLACVVDLGRKVARALFAAFDRAPSGREPHGLIHGDLAPADVFVDVGGNVRLHGLGMRPGRGEVDGPTCLTDRPVSPWSAPETLDGSNPVHASDVYALGAMLCQLMTGEPPPWASSSPDWHGAAAVGAAKRMTELSGEESFGELIEGMLAHDPAGRPRAEDVEKALARLHRRLDRGALADWCASAVPAAIEDAALRRRLESESLAAAGRGDDVDTAEIEPVAPPPDDVPAEPAPSPRRGKEQLEDEDTLEAPVSRKLWQIRAQTDAQRPRPLEWEDPSREDTGVVDPADLREEVPDPLAEDESEVLPMDTGQYVLDKATGELVRPSSDKLGMAVVPADGDDDDPSEAEATALGDDDRPAPPQVPQAPSPESAAPDDVPTLHDVDDAIRAEQKRRSEGAESPETVANAAMAAGATSTAAMAAAAAQARAAGPGTPAADAPAAGPPAADAPAADAPAADAPAAETPTVSQDDWDDEEAFFGGRGIGDAEPVDEQPAALPAAAAPPPPAPRPAEGLAPPPRTEGAGMNGWWLAVLASIALVVVMVWFTRQQQDLAGPTDGARPTAPHEGGTTAEGTPAEGTPAEGTPAEGTPAEGTPAEGTAAEAASPEGAAEAGAAAAGAAAAAAAAEAAAEAAAAEAAAAEAAAAASPEGAAAEAAARRDAQEAADRQEAESAAAAEAAAARAAERAAAALAAEEAAAARAAQDQAAARAAEQEAARRAAERAAAQQSAAERAAAAQEAAAAQQAAAERAASERAAEERAAAAAAQQAAAAAAERAAAQQAAAAAAAAERAAAQEAAAQQASGDGTVVITGDADGVTLSGSAGRFSGGTVPPGSYTVQATFGVNTVDVGSVDISAGQQVTVKCNANFLRCTIR